MISVGKSRNKRGSQSKNNGAFLPEIRIALSLSSAWAEDVTTVSNPTIRALKEKMKARFQALKPYYQKGALKEGGDGYLSVANTGDLNLKEKQGPQRPRGCREQRPQDPLFRGGQGLENRSGSDRPDCRDLCQRVAEARAVGLETGHQEDGFADKSGSFNSIYLW